MNISIFNTTHWVRRFGTQTNYKGYLTSSHTDFQVSLNVHPMGTDMLQALPEGERVYRHLEAHGTDVLRVANTATNTKGDLLYYNGKWYECTSAQYWSHTLLNHYNYTFVEVPSDASGSIDTSSPPSEA